MYGVLLVKFLMAEEHPSEVTRPYMAIWVSDSKGVIVGVVNSLNTQCGWPPQQLRPVGPKLGLLDLPVDSPHTFKRHFESPFPVGPVCL